MVQVLITDQALLYKMLHYVSSQDDNTRIDRWLKHHYPNLPFGMIARLLRTGKIKVDKKKVDLSTRIYSGQSVFIPEVQHKVSRPLSLDRLYNKYQEPVEQLKASVLYQDEDLLIINKPAGLAVQGGSKIDVSIDKLTPFLKFGSESPPLLVHRLDKSTTGALMLARSRKAAAQISRMIQSKQVQKYYLALLYGVPKPRSAEIKAPLAKLKRHGMELMSATEAGDNACTKYRVLDHTAAGFSLVEMIPITGRTHQLRAHSAHIGTPIFGDTKYNHLQNLQLAYNNKLHLHAYKIRLKLGDKRINVQAELPDYFSENLHTLGIQQF